MGRSKTGHIVFSLGLVATESRARRRPTATVWSQIFDLAIVTCFLFFLFM